MDIQEFQKKLFAKGKERDFSEMEIFYSSTKSTSVKVVDQEVKNYVITEQGGISFRGLYHNKMGYSFTEKFDEESIDLLVTEAMENAKVIELDDQEELFSGADHYESLTRYSESIAKFPPKDLIAAAFEMENTALAANALVKKVIQSSVAKSEGETIIANTKGLHCQSTYTNLSAGIYLMASDGKQTTTGGEYDFTLKNFADLNVKKVAETAAQEAVAKLGADSIATGNYPIIFRYDTATELINSFISIFSGEVVEKGFSRLQGKLGEKIAGDHITLIDDPWQEDTPGGAAFDAEGYPTKKLALIKDGTLLNFMHNRKTAKKAGAESTGHAAKSGYSGVVSVGPHNVYLKPGQISLADLIEKTDQGILIVELQGTNAGINTVSGDFSLSAIGFLIENGKQGRPINQITVSGNLYELLYQIEDIANDLQIKSTVSSPSIKVRSLTIAGN
ncbi:TldD/PmbA family protein [Pelosinus sp. sgz500959]|uniref:TldD/PmbA family protein n=1 Tax=Pelosinus sp. sgz500959 TaxID=3242472 RepID=UPI00366BBCCC